LVTATEEEQDALRGLGTYGFIKGAAGFIAGAVQHSPKDMEDYGYLMECIILYATDLGLGTCWLGGTFHKSNFAQKIVATEKEIVPAVTPVGYPTETRSTRDRVIRWGAGSKTRKPREELFFLESFDIPINDTDAGDYAVPLEMVRLGPSASNKQPWRIVKEKEKPIFHFYLQRSKGYERNMKPLKAVDLQRLDMGIAMCHFELTALDLGLKGKWKKLTPPDFPLPERTEYIVSWLDQGSVKSSE
jgi:hypothetical protein